MDVGNGTGGGDAQNIQNLTIDRPLAPPGAAKAPRRWSPTEEIGWSRTQEIRWSSTEEIGWSPTEEIVQLTQEQAVEVLVLNKQSCSIRETLKPALLKQGDVAPISANSQSSQERRLLTAYIGPNALALQACCPSADLERLFRR